MNVYTYVCIYIYIHMYAHVCVHTYICIYVWGAQYPWQGLNPHFLLKSPSKWLENTMDGGVLTIRPHRPFLSLWLLLDALFGQIQTLESGSLHSLPLSFAPGSRPLETSARICSWLTPSWIPALPSSLSLWLLDHALFGQIQTLESGSLYPFPSLWLLAHALFVQI